ncbi:MAG: trigger factor [Deltaproteobacteria bacterium]|nr:trigger factor [Deltaproteobacteria bacterium]
MKSDVRVDDTLHRTLTVELEWRTVADELAAAYRELAGKVNLKGFRKGKIPRGVLRQRFGAQVRKDVSERLVQDSYEAALIQHRLRPVARPELEIGAIEQGQPFVYTARLEVRPEIELKKIRGFALERGEAAVDEGMIAAELDRMREARSLLVPVEREEARRGDTAIIDYRTSRDGEPIEGGAHSDYELDLGAGKVVPGFEDEVLGMRVGEKRSFELRMPEQGVSPALAGVQLGFEVELKALKQREIPELNDEFARELSEEGAEDLDSLRALVQRRLAARIEQELDRKLERDLVDQLAEANPFPVPPALVKRQQARVIQEIEQLLRMQGLDVDRSHFGRARVQKSAAERAEHEVRISLLLEAVAEQEKIEVREEDVSAHLERLAASSGQNPARIKALYAEPERERALKAEIMQQKVLDYLKKSSNISQPGDAGSSPATGEGA